MGAYSQQKSDPHPSCLLAVFFRKLEGAMIMSITRTTHRTVTFFHPFHLPGHNGLLTPGEYEIDTLEKLDLSAPKRSYIKIECHVHLWSDRDIIDGIDTLMVDPGTLETALALDSDPMREEQRNKMIKSFGGVPTDDAA
jgi:hypothetical protein